VNSEQLFGFGALYFVLQGVEKSFCTSTEGPRPCAEPDRRVDLIDWYHHFLTVETPFHTHGFSESTLDLLFRNAIGILWVNLEQSH
jgi:hypothetical protein